MDPQSPPPHPSLDESNQAKLDLDKEDAEQENSVNEERERLNVQAMPLPKDFHQHESSDPKASEATAGGHTLKSPYFVPFRKKHFPLR